MAELLVKAFDYSHPDPVKDARGSYKRGMPVVVMPDGHAWGREERLPKFVVIKFPGVTAAKLRKYLDSEREGLVEVRRRVWIVRWADLPLFARNKLRDNGELTVAAGAYAGPRDYTWEQIRGFLRNQKTGLDETEGLS